MEKPVENYWRKRLEAVKEALEGNGFDVFVAQDAGEAKKIVLEEILPKLEVKSVSWGGSMTFPATGLYETLKDNPRMQVLDTYDRSLSPEENIERRRRSLLVDLFITGTNAVTETGKLVNLDGVGNRVAGITFGPRHVVILVGRNKLVPELEDAMFRIKNYAAPANAMRLDRKTPCAATSFCEECNSPDRICNAWSVLEKSFPKGRIKVVLINEDLGL
ncbi:MAG: lactate utilization protein [Deltaproteobacteria bacterium]|nr:lactate utilization protein [Deltaproteobacteria bacterium]